MINRNFTELYRPATGPMDLDAGKPNAKDAFWSALFTLVSLLFSAIGCWLAVWSIPDVFANKLWYILTAFGALLALFGLRFAWSMGNATIIEWEAYQIRKNQWHEVQLQAYRELKGIEVVRTYSEFELSPKYASHVLLAGLAVHYNMANSRSNGRSVPYSVRSLQEKLYIGSNHTILIGELKGTNPEQMSKLFADLGWIKNRRGGASGDWVPKTLDELVSSFLNNWTKLNTRIKSDDN